MTQTTGIIVGIVIGAADAVLIYAAFIGIRGAVRLGRSIVAALSGIPKLIESNQRTADRLELLVAILSGQAPVQNLESQVQASEGEVRPRMPQRPERPWETFTPAPPDAKESDTEVYDTSDEQLVAYEQLEELKARGIEVEDDLDKNEPGVTAHV